MKRNNHKYIIIFFCIFGLNTQINHAAIRKHESYNLISYTKRISDGLELVGYKMTSGVDGKITIICYAYKTIKIQDTVIYRQESFTNDQDLRFFHELEAEYDKQIRE